MNTSVTVSVPTLNAARSLPRMLRALNGQTVSNDILIIDSSSSDDTKRIAESFGARVMTIKREDFDHGATRNVAVREARGDIIVFLTQDAVPANERALEELIRPFSDARVAATYGRQLPNPGASVFAEHLRLFKYPAQARVKGLQNKTELGIETPFLSDSFSAYRKDALLEIGMFKQGIIFAEDVHAGARIILAGGLIAYVPDAMVYHSHDHTLRDELKRYFDTAVFYRIESWIGKTFGGNKGEAWRYTKSELWFLRKHHNGFILLQFFLRTTLRFLGFALGLWHSVLPSSVCRRLSAHPDWWNKKRPA